MSISCDRYERLPNLSCTKNDATTIKDSLLSQQGLYLPDLAFQLDSPTCNEIHDFFLEKISKIRECQVFTIFFSGHGGVHNENFYLCPKDYFPDLPSAHGISVAELIRYARDLDVKILNIVIDACQSGHSSTDLREAIEKPAKENKSSLCISIIASCLPDQSSLAGSPLSPFTKGLNDFIVGSADSQVARPILTLGDISHLIPEITHQSGKRQNVVHYSLNVLGPAHFCVNPLVGEKQRQPHNVLLSPQSNLGAAAFRSKDALEAVYASAQSSFQHKALVAALRPICDSSSTDLPALDELLWHYVGWFSDRVKNTGDWSIPFRIAASLSTASISVGWSSDSFVKSMALSIAQSLEADLKIFREAHISNTLEPLGIFSHEGINSFYFAPIRLSHCYARMGLCLIAANLGLLNIFEVVELVSAITTNIQREVPNLQKILNESQGYHLGIFFAACALTGNSFIAEQPFGWYLNDHHLLRGKVLRSECNVELALKYLRQRGSDPTLIEHAGIAIPNTTLPILMACAKILRLHDIIDPYLVGWNNLTTSIFIPEKSSSFGDKVMEQGINISRSIGVDFYSVEQYCDEVDQEHGKNFERTSILSDRGLIKCAAAYLYPDRFPWIF